MAGDDRTFKSNFSVEGVSALRDVVRGKLKEFMGDYTDDTLVDYVIVLLKNGRRKDEAKNELDVFLGDDSDPFVSWLWDHLGSNLTSYLKTEELHTDIEPKRQHIVGELSDRSDVDAKKINFNGKDSLENKNPEENADETIVSHKVENAVIKKRRYHADSQEEADSKKTSRSPRPSLDYKKRKAAEKQRRERDVLPTSVSAPRRLLQFAVRDAVATSRPSLKRLRSAVTKTTGDVPLEEYPKRIRRISMSTAIKAVAEAAEDVQKSRRSHNVFDRIGHDNDFPSTYGIQDFGVAAEDMDGENLSTEMVDFVSDYHVQNDNSRLQFPNMSPGHDYPEYSKEDYDVYSRQREMVDISHSSRNGVKSSQIFLHSSNEALHGAHRRLIHPEALANSSLRNASSLSMNSRKPQSRDVREVSEMDIGEHISVIRRTEPGMKSTKNTSPVVAFNGNVKLDMTPQKYQKSQSQIDSVQTGIAEEDTDSRTIFVNNVHFAATKDSLSRHFNKFGDVVKVIILTDPATGQPKGSAYVQFLKKDAAGLALSLDGTSFMSRILRIVKKSCAQPEAASVSTPLAARAPVFPPVKHFARLPISRGISSLYRARVKAGARSFQWKRQAESSVTAEAAANASNPKFPASRSFFTYVRTGQSEDRNSGNGA